MVVDSKCRYITYNHWAPGRFGSRSFPNMNPSGSYYVAKDFVYKICSLFNQGKIGEINKICLLNRNHKYEQIRTICVHYLKGAEFISDKDYKPDDL